MKERIIFYLKIPRLSQTRAAKGITPVTNNLKEKKERKKERKKTSLKQVLNCVR